MQVSTCPVLWNKRVSYGRFPGLGCGNLLICQFLTKRKCGWRRPQYLPICQWFGHKHMQLECWSDYATFLGNNLMTPSFRYCQILGMVLHKVGVECVVLHSMIPQRQRLASLAKFKSDQMKLLVATDVGSRWTFYCVKCLKLLQGLRVNKSRIRFQEGLGREYWALAVLFTSGGCSNARNYFLLNRLNSS